MTEDKIGVMLPGNVIVQEIGSSVVEVTTVNPTAAMTATGNEALRPLAATVREKLAATLAGL
jgi:hypothetical protein